MSLSVSFLVTGQTASILSKSRRSLKSLPCGWATSSPPRGTQVNHVCRESVSRGWRGQKQSPCCVCSSSLPRCPLPTRDTRNGTCSSEPRENPARPPQPGARRPSVMSASASLSAILFLDGQIKGVQQNPGHHSGAATHFIDGCKPWQVPPGEDSPQDARHPQERQSRAVWSHFQMRAHL